MNHYNICKNCFLFSEILKLKISAKSATKSMVQLFYCNYGCFVYEKENKILGEYLAKRIKSKPVVIPIHKKDFNFNEIEKAEIKWYEIGENCPFKFEHSVESEKTK